MVPSNNKRKLPANNQDLKRDTFYKRAIQTNINTLKSIDCEERQI